MKKFRVGLIGTGVISDIYLKTCQKFDILDVMACGSLDFEESRRKAEKYKIPEERLKGVSHYMSPKASVGNIDLSMYHAGSVPLNVGLHQSHPHCVDKKVKEVHTQIVGFGKMQQCLKRDINTLYLEEPLAPGATHKPMYDEQGNYPWHQYETITPGIFMAIEMLPSDEPGV